MYRILSSYLTQLTSSIYFLVNFSEQEIKLINSKAIQVIGKETSEKRSKMYAQGGGFAVSGQILLMDLLTCKIHPSLIKVLVMNKV